MRKIPNKSGKFGFLLTDLSKAFDCMTHDHLIAKRVKTCGSEKSPIACQ